MRETASIKTSKMHAYRVSGCRNAVLKKENAEIPPIWKEVTRGG